MYVCSVVYTDSTVCADDYGKWIPRRLMDSPLCVRKKEKKDEKTYRQSHNPSRELQKYAAPPRNPYVILILGHHRMPSVRS